MRYLADAKRRQRSRENVEDRLNVAISYKLVARLARARLQRANRRWRNRHPDLAALLAAERERRA